MIIELTDKQKYVLYKVVTDIKNGVKEVKIGGYAGTGKAQPLDALIATPNGFTTMGEVQIGQIVCTPSGRLSKITGIFPQGEKDIYRIWFSDKNYVECCDDHLWKVIDRHRLSNLKKYKTPYKIFKLSYIRDFINRLDGRNRFYIETTLPVQLEYKKTLIEPYLLGVLLGDGSIGDNNFRIHNEDQQILHKSRCLLKNWNCHLNWQEGVSYNIVGDEKFDRYSSSSSLKEALKELNLWNTVCETKFIPDCYLKNSIYVRLELLQGLMDTDGTVDYRTGMTSLTTTSSQLALNVCFLVESLGGICKTRIKKPKCKYKNKIVLGNIAYEINIGFNNTDQVFTLERKKELCKKRTKYKTRRCIRKIEYVGKKEAQCIMIDDPDHLYLTNHFIPTHNTTIIKYLVKFFPQFGTAAYTGKAANVMRKKGINSSTIHSRIYKPTFDNGIVYWDLALDPGCEGFIIDESSMVSEIIYNDLVTYDIPRIFVGDHGQLEPVDSKFNLMEKPDYTLEQIHRNAGDIARFAEHLRKGFSASSFKCEDGSVEFKYDRENSIPIDLLLSVDQVICAFNKTRVNLNAKIRAAKGYTDLVHIGEKIMCLRNNRKLALFNGMQGIVTGLSTGRYGRKFLNFQFDDMVIEGIPYDVSCFGQESYKIKHGSDTPNPFDYAPVITCHKSQGDEFGSVLVVEQICKNWAHKRWSYTAASRAKEKLYWNLA